MKPLWNFLTGHRADTDYCYEFLHIPKCAGSTIVGHLAALGNRGIGLSAKFITKEEIRTALRAKMKGQEVKWKHLAAIYGHRVFRGIASEGPRPTRFCFFLRDPVSRTISLYNYFATIGHNPNHRYYQRERERMFNSRGELIPVRQWLIKEILPNGIVNFLSGAVSGELSPGRPLEHTPHHLDLCKQAVDTAYFVGLVDSIQEDAALLLGKMGLEVSSVEHRNVSHKFFCLSDDPSIAEFIEEHSPLDVQLYRYACTRRAACNSPLQPRVKNRFPWGSGRYQPCNQTASEAVGSPVG